MSFHKIILPKFMRPFLKASPCYSTSIVKTHSGRELRSADYACHYTKYVLQGCQLSRDQFEQFNAFFRARMGQKFSFLLQDPAETYLPKHRVKVVLDGDGYLKIGEVYKYYHDEIMPAIKVIKHIVPSSVRIWIDDRDYVGECVIKNGFIYFRLDSGEGDARICSEKRVFLSAKYLIEARFNQDSFEYQLTNNNTIELSDISIIEVIN